MMLGLPASTELPRKRIIPKDAFFEKVGIKGKEREIFDSQVHRLATVALINSDTTNISKGEKISSIYVMEVQLNTDEYDDRILLSLDKMGHKMIYLLQFGERYRIAVVEKILFQESWTSEEPSVELIGLNLDTVWENIVRFFGDLDNNREFDDAIDTYVECRQLLKEIEILDKKIAKEKQNHVKRELYEKRKKLMSIMQDIANNQRLQKT